VVEEAVVVEEEAVAADSWTCERKCAKKGSTPHHAAAAIQSCQAAADRPARPLERMGRKNKARGAESAAGKPPSSPDEDLSLDTPLASSLRSSWSRGALLGAVLCAVASYLLYPRASAMLRSGAALLQPAANVMQPPALTAKAVLERAKEQPCKNRHDSSKCAQMVLRGLCESAPGWMGVMCAAACARCELLDPKVRCDPKTMNISGKDSYLPGGISKVFEHIANSPEHKGKVDFLLRDPHMALIRDFVTDKEAARLIELTRTHLKRSTDQGQFDESGYQAQVVSSGRTSSNAWCMMECETDPVVVNLMNRIANLTLASPQNFESFQVLRYNLKEKYDVHHDGSEDNHMPAGPRVLTFFLYLSDVEDGGETNFPALGVKVKPMKGAALVWPSVLDADPTKIDSRTTHAALPVLRGQKLAANTWIHLRDYRTPNIWGCTGSFDEV
jgi:predicted 2-oxoglutarate/Fe(II)-dependent dioxygenase YbiX